MKSVYVEAARTICMLMLLSCWPGMQLAIAQNNKNMRGTRILKYRSVVNAEEQESRNHVRAQLSCLQTARSVSIAWRFKCAAATDKWWAGYLSPYSDLLRAGRSGDQIPVGGEIFRTCPDRPWGPPRLLYNGYRVFPGGKERPGRDADPSPPSSAVVMKGQTYTSAPPMGRPACTEPQCLYKGALYLYRHVTSMRTIMSGEACIEVRYAKGQGLHGSSPPTHITVRHTRTIYNLLA